MVDFAFQEMFPQAKGDTPYRQLTSDFVEVDEYRGQRILRVDRQALTLLAAEALRDIAHLFRPGHLAQLAKILFSEAPRLREHLAIQVAGSPVTNERYCFAPEGNAYGAALTPARS